MGGTGGKGKNTVMSVICCHLQACSTGLGSMWDSNITPIVLLDQHVCCPDHPVAGQIVMNLWLWHAEAG